MEENRIGVLGSAASVFPHRSSFWIIFSVRMHACKFCSVCQFVVVLKYLSLPNVVRNYVMSISSPKYTLLDMPPQPAAQLKLYGRVSKQETNQGGQKRDGLAGRQRARGVGKAGRKERE